jgi:predicted alpha/beta-hydrolase family hydrolase
MEGGDMKYDSFKCGAGRVGPLPLVIAFVLLGAGCGQAPSGQSSGATGFGNPGSSGSESSSGSSGADGSGGSPGSSGSSGSGGSPGGSSGASGSGGSSGSSGSSSGGSSGSSGASGDGGANHSGTCLNGITDYENAGPFTFMATASGSVKIWVPMVPAGCKVPVIHLANGTGATCSAYQAALERFASHGFLTTCYEDPNTGAGTQGVTAFETALMMYPNLADNKLGSTGHSQGGQAAFTVLQLSEAKWGSQMIYAGLAMEPASGFGTQPAGGTWQQVYAKIKSPMFMFSGTADTLVSSSWVGQAYSAMSTTDEVYWWSATGATHIPVPNVPEEQVSIPWFRWKLLGDNAACKFFKAIPGNSMISPGWTKMMSENEKPCQ